MQKLIVIGYPGIGKTTLAMNDVQYIDLDSSAFWVDNKRPPKWWIPYCNIAVSLAEEGYVVFVSSQVQVREYLLNSPIPLGVDIALCFPDMTLRIPWIDRLRTRYERTQLDKDYRAWKEAETHYYDNIRQFLSYKGNRIVIDSMEYDLKKLLEGK